MLAFFFSQHSVLHVVHTKHLLNEWIKCILSLLASDFAHTLPLPRIPFHHLLAWLAFVSLKTQLRCFLCPEAFPAALALTWVWCSSFVSHWHLTSTFIIAVITFYAVAYWFVCSLDCEHLEGGDSWMYLVLKSACYMNTCTHEHHNYIRTVAKIWWTLTVSQSLS